MKKHLNFLPMMGLTPNPEYEVEINKSSRVMASYTRKSWKEEPLRQAGKGTEGGSGWKTIVYQIPPLNHDMYFRLYGTNLGRNVKSETDKEGNPLSDELLAPNTQDKAYADLWFYSNPIFVRVARHVGSELGGAENISHKLLSS